MTILRIAMPLCMISRWITELKNGYQFDVWWIWQAQNTKTKQQIKTKSKRNENIQAITPHRYLQKFTFSKLLKISFQNFTIHWISSESPSSVCLLTITKTKCRSKFFDYTTNLRKVSDDNVCFFFWSVTRNFI